MDQKDNNDSQQDYKSHRAWYVVHTYSGYENKVKANLEKKIVAQDLGDVIFDVVVPMRMESEYKDGKRRSIQKKIFPGYVLVDMIVNNYSWFVVRNTQGVTGFVGAEKDPIPLTDEEARKILDGMAASSPVAVGDEVTVKTGWLKGKRGVVTSIIPEENRAQVQIDGKNVDIELSELKK